MNRKILLHISIIISVVITMFTGCKTKDNAIISTSSLQKSIVILYENDVHCAIDGYAKLAGFRDAIVRSDTSYVGVVSCGDFLQGSLAGAISRGQYIVDVMRNVDYDAITLGNHEFDYGVPRMEELLPQIGSPIVCSNYFTFGATTPTCQPYVIRQYGPKRIAFVGVLTPETMRSEGYSFYTTDGTQLYDLRTNDVYRLVQESVDRARSVDGVDYVVVLSHLGEINDTGIDSHGLIASTRGIDVVLDGHSHSVIPTDHVANLDGKLIPVTQTGTQFANIGKLYISRNGEFTTSLLPTSDIPYSNARVTATVDSINTLMDAVASRRLIDCPYEMPVRDANAIWTVRRMETTLGNLVSDAFRNQMHADIGVVNGGGIRNELHTGPVTYGDVVSVQPFDNRMVRLEATGADLMAMLVKCTSLYPGPDGQFPQVSGMRYTIHATSHTVSDVLILNATTGEYEPMQTDRTYTVATTDYYSNGGFYNVLQHCKLLDNPGTLSRDALAAFLETMPGRILGEEYRDTQGRITIVND